MTTIPNEETSKPPLERPEPPPIVDVKESDEHKPKPQMDQQ